MSSPLSQIENTPPPAVSTPPPANTTPTTSSSTARHSQRDRRVPHRFNPLGRTGRTTGNNGSDEPDEPEDGDIRTTLSRTTPSRARGTRRRGTTRRSELPRQQPLDHDLPYTTEQLQALIDAKVRETNTRIAIETQQAAAEQARLDALNDACWE